MSPIRGVVLDLWNTLAHHPGVANPVERLGSALGVASRPGWIRTLAGASMTRPFASLDDALPAIEGAFGLPADLARRERAASAWREADGSAALFPDVLPALDVLRAAGYRLGLLSNTQCFGLSVLERTGLGRRLDAVCLSCRTGFLKPDPRAFAAVVAALGLPPREVLMVGDSFEDDVEGARAAGLSAILLRRDAQGLSHREGDLEEPSIPDLDALAARLGDGAGASG